MGASHGHVPELADGLAAAAGTNGRALVSTGLDRQRLNRALESKTEHVLTFRGSAPRLILKRPGNRTMSRYAVPKALGIFIIALIAEASHASRSPFDLPFDHTPEAFLNYLNNHTKSSNNTTREFIKASHCSFVAAEKKYNWSTAECIVDYNEASSLGTRLCINAKISYLFGIPGQEFNTGYSLKGDASECSEWRDEGRSSPDDRIESSNNSNDVSKQERKLSIPQSNLITAEPSDSLQRGLSREAQQASPLLEPAENTESDRIGDVLTVALITGTPIVFFGLGYLVSSYNSNRKNKKNESGD